MSKPLLIATAYASIGSGHRIAAEAFAEEMRAHLGESDRVEQIDVLNFAAFRPSGETLTAPFSNGSKIYDWIWSTPAIGKLSRLASAPFLQANFKAFVHRLRELNPDVLVCTHALPALLATQEVKSCRLSTRVLCVASDYGIHSFWPVDGVSMFCAPNQQSVEVLWQRGFDESRTTVTGIPVRPQFTLDYDFSGTRQRFNLGQNSQLVLAIAGSTSHGAYRHMSEGLEISLPTLASLPNTSVLVVTGRDAELADRMRARADGFGNNNVHILGYEPSIAPLMAAASVCVAKPGGSICAEAMASSLPLVLVGPSVGQELANARALSQSGAAKFVDNARMIGETVRRILSRPRDLEVMKRSCCELGRPFAASTIAQIVLRLAQSDESAGSSMHSGFDQHSEAGA